MKTISAVIIAFSLSFILVGQEVPKKHEPVKLVEIERLTKVEVKEKLIPIWDAHKCTDPWVKWVISYGPPNEVKRRQRLISDSIGLRCDTIGFRVLFVDRESKKARTVIWNVWPGDSPPPDEN